MRGAGSWQGVRLCILHLPVVTQRKQLLSAGFGRAAGPGSASAERGVWEFVQRELVAFPRVGETKGCFSSVRAK